MAGSTALTSDRLDASWISKLTPLAAPHLLLEIYSDQGELKVFSFNGGEFDADRGIYADQGELKVFSFNDGEFDAGRGCALPFSGIDDSISGEMASREFVRVIRSNPTLL